MGQSLYWEDAVPSTGMSSGPLLVGLGVTQDHDQDLNPPLKRALQLLCGNTEDVL
jgi:hypothetical protein